MLSKLKEKERAIILRKKGLSYSEILKEIQVAKSTLSLWLRGVGLAIKQKQRLTEKRLAASRRGGLAKSNYRQTITKEIKSQARNEIGHISDRELWLIGAALYWAEGSKEKDKSVGLKFSNSDPRMIKLFLEWLKCFCKITKNDIYFEIYLHKSVAEREERERKYWLGITKYPTHCFKRTIWKKNKIRTKRKNVDENYHGQLRICVKKSTNLNRKIEGWIEGIYKNCGVV